MEDRYRPDFPRYDHRFHDFDHRDRSQYQDHVVDRSASAPCLQQGQASVLSVSFWLVRVHVGD